MTTCRPIRLNAFDMACVGHIQHGMWTHPRDHSSDYTSLEHWVGLARMLERGLFDGLFLADVLGAYDVYGGNADASLRGARADPAARSDGAGAGNGLCDHASRLWRDLQPCLRGAFPVRPPHGDIGSSDAWPDRVEHRHRLSRQCGARHGFRCADRARRPLRFGGRIPAGGLRAVGGRLGRRRGGA